MNFELILKEEADREIGEGYRWYELQRKGLGELFLDEVDKYLVIIKKNPHLFAKRHNNQRAAILRQFPYIIVYEKLEEQIIVYAVFNTKQDPHKWKR